MGMRIAAAQSLRCIRPLITSETSPSPLTTTMPLYRPSSMLLTSSEPCPAAVVCTTSVDTPAARSSGATEASYSVAAAPEPEAGLTSTRSGARAVLPLALTAASTAAGAAPQPAASAALSDSSNAWPSAAVAAISSSRGWWTRCRSQPGVSPIGLFFACLWSDASYGAWLTVAASVPPAEPGATLMPAMSASGRRPAAGKPSSELTQRASAVSARAVAPGCALPSLRPAARRQCCRCWSQPAGAAGGRDARSEGVGGVEGLAVAPVRQKAHALAVHLGLRCLLEQLLFHRKAMPTRRPGSARRRPASCE